MYIKISPATEAFVPALNDIDSNSGFWEWKDWIHQASAAQGRVLLATVGQTETDANVPAGYLRHGSFLWDDRAPFIQMVRVSEAFRRKGIARALMQAFEEDVRELKSTHLYEGVYSSVETTNEPSIALHEGLGYIAVGILPLPDQEVPEIIYYKKLAPEQ